MGKYEESMRKLEIESEIRRTRKDCEDCGVILTEENRDIDKSPLYAGIQTGLCKKCKESRDIKALEEEEKQKLYDMEDRRMAIDSFMIGKVNVRIPAMYQTVNPHIYDARMREPAALIYGDFGTGKTYAGYGYVKYERLRRIPKGLRVSRNEYTNIIHELEEDEKDDLDHSVGYLSSDEDLVLDGITLRRAFTIMKELKDGMRDGKQEKIFNQYVKRDILIIDEYGKNMSSDYEESTLFELINTRFEELRQTILIVNASNKNELLNIVRPDILDRFRGNLIEMSGNSRR